MFDDIVNNEDEKLDPRILEKLEELNHGTEKINLLEKRFEERNSAFRIILNESSDKLKTLSAKLGKCVEDSRPYYDAKEKFKQAQFKSQKAAINYEKAFETHKQAKEAIKMMEIKFKNTDQEFDSHSQEILNQANIRLMETERLRKENETIHHHSMMEFLKLENQISFFEKKFKKSINRSKVYFDEQLKFRKRLTSIKEEIELLVQEINSSKKNYSAVLHKLEDISEQIHEKRNAALLRLFKREPGVGAETEQFEFKESFRSNVNQNNKNTDLSCSEASSILSQMIEKVNLTLIPQPETSSFIELSNLPESESSTKS